jgi:hypothetical protein
VCHQSHKLTTYSFGQAAEAVLGEPTALVLPEVLVAASTERLARHAIQQARQVSTSCQKLPEPSRSRFAADHTSA